ncbi:MAG: DNA adenine methylase [Flavipsychrobacter sp.]|nr:DNA adenine methylase [Flavipsychrobacter sp.]
MEKHNVTKKNKLVAPFLKWVGGKRQLMSSINEQLPKKYSVYYEPFVGGGAVLFHLQPTKAIINDSNSELTNVYRIIKDDVENLIDSLKIHKNDAEYFYQIRSLDRKGEFHLLSDVERASRIIFLNKTCYNGLYRVNNSGEFNAPFGKYKNPNIVNETTLRAVSKYLNTNDVKIFTGDYEAALKNIDKNAFVYFDPPYHPASETSNFTGYVKGGFDIYDQTRLRNICNELNQRGIKFLLSNSATDFIKDLYSEYNINVVKATRSINSDGEKRGEVDEVLIKNYE